MLFKILCLDLDEDFEDNAFGEADLRDIPEEGLDFVSEGDLDLVTITGVCLNKLSKILSN